MKKFIILLLVIFFFFSGFSLHAVDVTISAAYKKIWVLEYLPYIYPAPTAKTIRGEGYVKGEGKKTIKLSLGEDIYGIKIIMKKVMSSEEPIELYVCYTGLHFTSISSISDGRELSIDFVFRSISKKDLK